MRHEILLNFTPLETRVAVVEQGMLQEILIERATHRGLVGNVYLGQVVRVLPGMQACFVDIGLDRSAFLHTKDFPSSQETHERSIQQLVTEGQSLLVQVIKDPVGSKGARLTAEVSLPARHLVLMPFATHVGISQRIDDEATREHLKTIAVEALKAQNLECGVIIRTAGDGQTTDDLEEDLVYLKRVWDNILKEQQTAKAPALLFEELPLTHRMIRDQIRRETDRVFIDSLETYTKLSQFASKFMPELSHLIQHYQGDRPIFDLYQIEDEIEKALSRQVELKSGAYLVVDQTEAMTTIDVNTGRFVGAHTLEQTVFRTNLEAAVAIGRQLRLRNLGGMVVIDFIDMDDDEHRRQVLRTLERSLDEDPVKTRVIGFNDLGLVVLTRKRSRESLSDLLQEPCPHCHGTGQMKTAETVCYEIFRAVMREYRAYSAEMTTVIAAPTVIDRLIDEESEALADLEAFIHRPIRLQVDGNFSQDRYEVVVS
ncbi:MAG: ribonuclease G [Litoricola sp.]|jgi:ribonuclease G|nr:ribonuclease G [Litorivicinus sp.]MBL6810051.1 ribonuclease G [Litorivicinus sp.]MBL6824382.1 ribonuclease G [Litorivicinus sp.]HAB68664.1 ribonuclease G [Gammaproteobacteria bacterium]HAB77911.1 ribonuclease G [Gammaproteobacteria bacterium]